jgi:hypothetical protein
MRELRSMQRAKNLALDDRWCEGADRRRSQPDRRLRWLDLGLHAFVTLAGDILAPLPRRAKLPGCVELHVRFLRMLEADDTSVASVIKAFAMARRAWVVAMPEKHVVGEPVRPIGSTAMEHANLVAIRSSHVARLGRSATSPATVVMGARAGPGVMPDASTEVCKALIRLPMAMIASAGPTALARVTMEKVASSSIR